MAPIKFEENIREKLQDRELQPSKEAWNKLAATLEDEPQKKNNRMLWMAVAASFMGVLFVVSFLIGTKNDTTTNQIVEGDNMNPPVEETLVNDPKIEIPIIENATESIAGADKLKEESLSEKENIRKNNTSQIVATTKNKEKQFIDRRSVNSEEIKTPFKEKVTDEALVTNNKKVENTKLPALINFVVNTKAKKEPTGYQNLYDILKSAGLPKNVFKNIPQKYKVSIKNGTKKQKKVGVRSSPHLQKWTNF